MSGDATGQDTDPTPPKERGWAVYLGVLALVGALAGAYKINAPVCQWAVAIAGLLILLASVGWFRSGTPFGALITDRYVMSLSRLQMVLWTVLVLSAYAVGVFIRLRSGVWPEPLELAIDPKLWTLIGINTAALIGTPFILAVRGDQPTDPTAIKAAAAEAGKAFKESPDLIAERSDGPIYVNASAADARLTDIFEGDEVGNTHTVDLAKVQMFFFTVISALVWSVTFAKQLHGINPATLKALPTLPDGMLALLGFSNTAYLANKGINHTTVTSPTTPTS